MELRTVILTEEAYSQADDRGEHRVYICANEVEAKETLIKWGFHLHEEPPYKAYWVRFGYHSEVHADLYMETKKD